MRLFTLLVASITLAACAGDDRPSDYGASTPAQAPASDADARLADAEARAAAAEAQLAAAQQAPGASESSASSRQSASGSSPGGSYTLGPNPNREYNGSLYLAGETVFCETYDRTSVAAFRGMELCYRVDLEQHPRDGSLAGSGVKISEETQANGFRELPAAQQSPVRVSGYIDNDDVIHLEYAVRGAQRTTRAVGQYRSSPDEGPDTFRGTFRTDAANASGAAVLESY